MQKTKNESKYMSPDEVADKFGVSRMTVYRMLKRGEIKGVKFGGQWRIDVELLPKI